MGTERRGRERSISNVDGCKRKIKDMVLFNVVADGLMMMIYFIVVAKVTRLIT